MLTSDYTSPNRVIVLGDFLRFFTDIWHNVSNRVKSKNRNLKRDISEENPLV
jgi:hypothetical protein